MRYIIERAYFTDNLEAMASFYQQVLDCDPGDRSEGLASFQTGTVKLFLHQNYEPGAEEIAPENHIAIAVKNVDELCTTLAEKGIVVEIPPKDYYWGRSAYIRDPDGHQVEFNPIPGGLDRRTPVFCCSLLQHRLGIHRQERTDSRGRRNDDQPRPGIHLALETTTGLHRSQFVDRLLAGSSGVRTGRSGRERSKVWSNVPGCHP